MNRDRCELEDAIVGAVRTDRWTEDLRTHADQCSVCAETVFVATALNQEAEVVGNDRPLPDPGHIWWRARLESRRATMHRATRGIVVLQHVAAVLGVALAFAFLLWQWPHLRDWLRSLVGSATAVVSVPSGLPQPVIVLLASTCVLLFFVLFGYFDTWAED